MASLSRVATRQLTTDATLRAIWPLLRPSVAATAVASNGVNGFNLTAGRALLARGRGPILPPKRSQTVAATGEPSTLLSSWNNTLIALGAGSAAAADDGDAGAGVSGAHSVGRGARCNERRLLSMDVGDRVVGLAISDATNQIALSIPPMHRRLRSHEWRPHSPGFKASSPSKSSNCTDSRHMSATSYRPWYDISVQELASPLSSLIHQYGIAAVVVGLPLTMSDGREDAQTLKTRTFITQLWHAMINTHNTNKVIGNGNTNGSNGIPVIWWDERLSTQEAKMELREAGIHGHVRQKDIVDSICARNILQEVIEYGEELTLRR